jgi:hypothetical protein
MSLSGVYSNRDDDYQTLIALHWAVTMLHDPSIVAIEVDATSLDPSGNPVVVEDVVMNSNARARTLRYLFKLENLRTVRIHPSCINEACLPM